MVKLAHVIRSFNTKDYLYVVSLLISCICIFSLNAQVFQPPEPASVFPAQEVASSESGVYQPFTPFNPSQQLGGTNPVLFGPGGEPIGGLPATNGAHLLFFGVLVYSVYKLITQRKNPKKLNN